VERITQVLAVLPDTNIPTVWREGMWSRGWRDTLHLANAKVIVFTVISVTVAGAVGANAFAADSRLVRTLLGSVVGLLGFLVALLLLLLFFALRAPFKQRDEAREHLAEAGDLKRLLLLQKYLTAASESNRRILYDLENEARSGPVSEFDDPWLREQNEQLRIQLQRFGYPELIHTLVLTDSELLLDTWENVLLSAKCFDKKIGDFLGDPVFHALWVIPEYIDQ
jgi:hypothetical protein